MGDTDSVATLLESTASKIQQLQKAFAELESHRAITLNLKWKQLEEHFHGVENSLKRRFTELDQRMKEMNDHLTVLIKPLENAIGVLKSNSLARITNSEVGGSSQAAEKVSYKAFKSTSPPTFEGFTDPIKAVEWLTKMEACFELAESNDVERVRYATSCLIGGALMWWTTTSKTMEASVLKALSWEKFKDLFEEKYCPLDRLDELEYQFMSLTQGDKSVIEYEDEFLKLSLFSKHQVSTERRKIQRFVMGLKPEIRQFVRGRDISTFSKAVEAARDQEQELALSITESVAIKKPKLAGIFHQNSPRSSFKYTKEWAYAANAQSSHSSASNTSQGSGQFSQSRPPNSCNRCGKYHKGNCPFKRRVCYRCREPGHISLECPQGGIFYCSRCHEPGHTNMMCPNRQPQSESQGSVAMPASTPMLALAASVVPRAPRPALTVPVRASQITAD